MLLALIVRFVAVFLTIAVALTMLFATGRVPFDPNQPGFARHVTIDWGCPRCGTWGEAYVSRLWRERARRHAIGLVHARISPSCPSSEGELLIT